FRYKHIFKDLKPWCDEVILRPIKLITAKLSPMRVLVDLFQLENCTPLFRPKGDVLCKSSAPCEPITLTLIAHFWTADLFRIFGQRFLATLLAAEQGNSRLRVQPNKLLRFCEGGRGASLYVDPVLGYFRANG